MAIESRRLRWAGHVARMRDLRSVLIILVRTTKAMKSHGKLRGIEEDNIKRHSVSLQTEFS